MIYMVGAILGGSRFIGDTPTPSSPETLVTTGLIASVLIVVYFLVFRK